jgi:poly-gamma-glutamate synthesis protein (capsule biosynthesis protein)
VTVERRRLDARRLVVSVALVIGACSPDADVQSQAGGKVARDRSLSSTHGLHGGQNGGSGVPAAYQASVRRLDAGLRRRMRLSHHAGCPVRLNDLRYLRMTYVDFDGNARTGEMVVNKAFAEPVTEVFERLYKAHWPIARMRLVDDYGGVDDRSMADNNTSSYNCRHVAGTDRWSAMRTVQRSTSTPCRTRI